MKRIIGDKLNFLMLLTETKNNILGKAIAFDPSYISRIRTGARGVPKHRDFIYPAAAFFARAIQTKEQEGYKILQFLESLISCPVTSVTGLFL